MAQFQIICPSVPSKLELQPLLHIGKPISPSQFQVRKAICPFSHTFTELSFLRFFICRTQHRVYTKQRGFYSLAVFIYQINQVVFGYNSFSLIELVIKSLINVWSLLTCMGTLAQYRLHAYQSEPFSKSFKLSSISGSLCFVFLSSNTFVIRGCSFPRISLLRVFILSDTSFVLVKVFELDNLFCRVCHCSQFETLSDIQKVSCSIW